MNYFVCLINIVSNHCFAGDLKKGYTPLYENGILSFNDEFYDVQHTMSKEVLLKKLVKSFFKVIFVRMIA